jgi:hypothetical protein
VESTPWRRKASLSRPAWLIALSWYLN